MPDRRGVRRTRSVKDLIPDAQTKEAIRLLEDRISLIEKRIAPPTFFSTYIASKNYSITPLSTSFTTEGFSLSVQSTGVPLFIYLDDAEFTDPARASFAYAQCFVDLIAPVLDTSIRLLIQLYRNNVSIKTKFITVGQFNISSGDPQYSIMENLSFIDKNPPIGTNIYYYKFSIFYPPATDSYLFRFNNLDFIGYELNPLLQR